MNRRELEMWSPREVARLLSLLEAERRYYQEIMAAVPSGTGIVGQDGTLELSNRALRTMLGIDPLSEGSPHVEQLLPSEHLRSAVPQMLAGALTEPVSELSMRADGRWMRFSIRPFRDWDDFSRMEVLLTVEESTEAANQARAAAEAELEEARERLTALPACSWDLDVATMRFTSVDAGTAEAMGLDGDCWREGADFWGARVHPGDLARLKGYWDLSLRGAAVRSCDYGTPVRAGHAMRLRDYWTVIRDEARHPVRVRGLTMDITSEYEIARLSSQGERVEAMHDLAGRIVHDSNNLLMILSGYGEELLHGLPSDNPLRGHVQEILSAGDRLSLLTSRLAASTRRDAEPETHPAVLDAQLEEWREPLAALAGTEISVKLALGAPGAATSTDVTRLRSGLELMLRRAIPAMRDGGEITISTRLDHREAATAAPEGALHHAAYIRLEIHDSGRALHPDARARLFEPNLSGDAASEEMARFYRFLREVGGDAVADSDYQSGTTITLFLPALEAAPGAAVPVQPQLAPAAPPPTILVVDDEDGIRVLMGKVLRREGFEVIEASNGDEALEKAAAYWGAIPLLVTDVVMPGMGGIDLASQLSQARPETRVLFISGYTGQSSLASAQLARGYEFLQKPFTLSAFLGKVRGVLAAAKAAGGAA